VKRIIFILFITCVFCYRNVYAMTLELTGAKEGILKENINIYITLNKDYTEHSVSAIEGMLVYDENVFELIETENLMNDWRELSKISNNKVFAFANLTYNNLINDINKNIIKLTFKIKEKSVYGDKTISIINSNATDELGNGLNIIGGEHKVRILSDNNYLNELIINDTKIDLDKNKNDYELTVNKEVISIKANTEDKFSKITGDVGTKTLNYGINEFKIIVLSESGKKRVYNIKINREDNRSKENRLSNLTLSSGKIKFDSDIINYDIIVDNIVDYISIDASLMDLKSIFVEGFGPRTIKLNEGENLIRIKVKAENNQIKTYNITVIRKKSEIIKNETTTKNKITTEKKNETLSNNNYLSEINVNNVSLNFIKEEYEVLTIVPYDTDKVNFQLKTENKKATFTIDGNKELIVGRNIYNIKVIAEDGSVRNYQVIIVRKEEDDVLSNNSKLENLEIKGYKINFDKEVYDYFVKIKNEDELDILYRKDDNKSNVNIVGNKNLKFNNIVRVTVVAEDNSITEYRIKVLKNTTSYNLFLIVLSILSFGLLKIIVDLFFENIQYRRKNNFL